MLEEAKKKKKKRKRCWPYDCMDPFWALAPFYGKGDGSKSPATFPANQYPLNSPLGGQMSPGPAYPGAGGSNASGVPGGAPNAGMGPVHAGLDFVGFLLGEELRSERNVLSYKDILRWKKEFQQMIALTAGQKFRSLDDAVRDFAKIEKLWRTFFENLRQWIDLSMGFKYWDKLPVGGKTFSPHDVLKEMQDQVATQLDHVYPGKWLTDIERGQFDMWIKKDNSPLTKETVDANIDYFVNGMIAKFGTKALTGSSADLISLGEKMWEGFRLIVKKTAEPGAEGAAAKIGRGFTDIPKQITGAGLTFVNSAEADAHRFESAVDLCVPYARIMAKLMPEVMYGPVFLKWNDGMHRKVGSMEFEGASGLYDPSHDTVTLMTVKPRPPTKPGEDPDRPDFGKGVGTVLVHELAHRFYFRFMTQEQRGRYAEMFAKRSQSVSDYGNQVDVEDFAETVKEYVAKKGNMAERDARERLEAILSGRRLTNSCEIDCTGGKMKIKQLSENLAFINQALSDLRPELDIDVNDEPCDEMGRDNVSVDEVANELRDAFGGVLGAFVMQRRLTPDQAEDLRGSLESLVTQFYDGAAEDCPWMGGVLKAKEAAPEINEPDVSPMTGVALGGGTGSVMSMGSAMPTVPGQAQVMAGRQP